MKVSELRSILKDMPDNLDVVVSINVNKRVDFDTGGTFNECRDIINAELTTEYYRCVRYNIYAVPVLALKLEYEVFRIE